MVRVLGRLHWNGATFPPGGDRKHDERMVVEKVLEGPARVQHEERLLTAENVAAWEAVIDSYHRAREHDRTPLTNYGDYIADPKRWRTLLPGDTLHVEFGDDDQIIGLYPAMVGRKPFPGPPRVSLPATHRPAESLSELSPADRVFGWVRQGADRAGVAYRGHLRVLPPDDRGAPRKDTVKTFKRPVALAILATPKPTQFRFYLGGADGKPLGKVAKTPSEGYPAEPGQRRLRGRKVYLTHGEVLHGQPGADDYWNPDGGPKQPVTVAGHHRYREYLLPEHSANPELVTRISGWVKPDTTFRFTLQVDNLTRLELAALLWLLELPNDDSLKLGLGKPLGFGAVKVGVDWDNTRLFHGDRLLDRYRVISARPVAEPTINLKNSSTNTIACFSRRCHGCVTSSSPLRVASRASPSNFRGSAHIRRSCRSCGSRRSTGSRGNNYPSASWTTEASCHCRTGPRKPRKNEAVPSTSQGRRRMAADHPGVGVPPSVETRQVDAFAVERRRSAS